MKIAVGISGGIDSLVAAHKLLALGHDIVGVTMTLGRDGEAQMLHEAQNAAAALNIQLFTRNLADEWRKSVSEYIKSTYQDGKTPNPCIRCNEFIKFGLLPRWAFSELGCDAFATGHYARLEKSPAGSIRLLRAVDRQKDQSYFLYRVPAEILARTIFPLGEMTKSAVRKYAAEHQLPVAEKPDSQDFCGGDVRNFINLSPKTGNIVTADGKILGQHYGYWNYTIGKRKGLGIGGGVPYYVVKIIPSRNEVVVAHQCDALSFTLNLANPIGRIDFKLPVKVRSAGEPKLLADGILGVAPGQSAVFYDGDEIVGGGIIL